MIYVSTGGESQTTAAQTSARFLNAGIEHIELSGGLHDPYYSTELIKLKDRCHFQVHNYFPPPAEPFVLNLASDDKQVADTTMAHVHTAMDLAVALGRPVYSFHAGFLLDPKASELGKRIGKRPLMDRQQAMARFVSRLNDLAEQARIKGVQLLVENNCLSANNYKHFAGNPFLMADAEECIYVMENTPDNVNQLVDVAHLKVSANSLSFDAVTFLQACAPWIKAYHLSDNDGSRDSNQAVTESSWFWPHLKTDLDYYTLEVYGLSPEALCRQRDLTRCQLELGGVMMHGKIS